MMYKMGDVMSPLNSICLTLSEKVCHIVSDEIVYFQIQLNWDGIDVVGFGVGRVMQVHHGAIWSSHIYSLGMECSNMKKNDKIEKRKQGLKDKISRVEDQG